MKSLNWILCSQNESPASPAAQAYAAPAARWVTGTDGTGVLRGRMKFCRPTFRAVARADRPLAVEVFTANKVAFHPIARRLIEKVRVESVVSQELADRFVQDLGLA